MDIHPLSSAFPQMRLPRLAALRRARVAFVIACGLALGPALQAAAPLAAPDEVHTLQQTAVTIPVLANDTAAPAHPLAILQVTQPAHGRVSLNTNSPVANAELARLFQFAGVQLSNTVVQIGDTNLFPRATQADGTWVTRPVDVGNWVSGYFPGALWYLYEQTGDTHYRTWAENWMGAIASMQYCTEVDDVGSMIYFSFGHGYRLTGNSDWRTAVLNTAQSFATRWNGAAGVLPVWGAITNAPVWVNIDTLMNIEVLFRAYDLGGSTNFYTYAYSDALHIMANHVRPDGSTYQRVWYDGNTGAVLSRDTIGGASNESCWARGQGWGVHGFTMAYRETGDLRFLATAQKLADYYIAHLPADSVPYWDFQAPHIPNEPRDSSAASVTLSGLVQLSQFATNLQDSARYWQAARRILDSLGSTNYLAQGSTSSGILLHGVGETPPLGTSELDVSLIYGDYYFVEALQRYAGTYRRTTLTYTPEAGFQGTDTFTYQACDDAGNCTTGAVSVVVEPLQPSAFAVQLSLAPGTHWPTLSFPSTAGRFYHAQYRDELSGAGSWSLLATNIAGSGLPMSLSDTNPASHRFYRVGVTMPASGGDTVSLPATSGTLAAPFVVSGDYVYQAVATPDPTAGGRAAYNFTITNAGPYVIQALVSAPNEGANSFFVNIDAEPQAPAMIWDIPLTSGFEQRLVSWRGNGTDTANQFVPKVFNLTSGAHQLIIRGREAYTLLQSLTILPSP